MNYVATPFVLQWLFNILILVSLSYVIVKSDEFCESISSFRRTERLILSWMGAVATLACIYFRFEGIRQRNSTLQFWEDNVRLLAAFANASIPGLNENMSTVRTSARNSFLTLACIIFGYIAIMVSIPLAKSPSEKLGEFGLSSHPVMFLATVVFSSALLLHPCQEIWLLFFFKIYTSLFSLIVSKLGDIEQWLSGIALTFPPQALSSTLDLDIRECYELYRKVEDQSKKFSLQFGKELIGQCAFGILNIISYTFVFLRWASSWPLDPVKFLASLLLLTPVIISCKNLYELATEGSQLTSAALEIADRLYNVYHASGRLLSFQQRQDLQTMALKIRTSPPAVNAGEYVVFSRQLVITVSYDFGLRHGISPSSGNIF